MARKITLTARDHVSAGAEAPPREWRCRPAVHSGPGKPDTGQGAGTGRPALAAVLGQGQRSTVMRVFPVCHSAVRWRRQPDGSAPALRDPGSASTIQNGVEMVCTGVGSAADNPAWERLSWSNWTFSNMAPANMKPPNMSRMTQGGQSVAESDCDAPWLLIKAHGRPVSSGVCVAARRRLAAPALLSTSAAARQKTVNLAFPALA